MAEVSHEVFVAASPELVWVALGDFAAISSWAPNVDHSCLITEHGDQPGSVRRVQVGRNALLERIVEREPAERLSYEIEGLPPLVRSAVNSWTLTEHATGTRVALATTIDAGPRPPQQVAARAFARVMARASRQMLDGLKTHVESDASQLNKERQAK